MRRLNVHALYRSLDNLCTFLRAEYNINNGGCCYVAYLIAKHLEELGIEYDLVIYSEEYKNIDLVENELFNKKANSISFNSIVGNNCCSHYCIKIKGSKEVNSGKFGLLYGRYVISHITSSHINWIYKEGGWNEAYDTNNNEIIKLIIKAFFKKYEGKQETKRPRKWLGRRS